jgi:hypothetical protein
VQKSFPVIEFFSKAQGFVAGWNESMTKIAATNAPKPTSILKFEFELKKQMKMFIFSCLISFIISGGVIVLDICVRIICKRGIRIPKAIV